MKAAEFKEQQLVITGGRFIATLIIILFLIVFSLALVSYFGDSADLELKEALKTCITSQENINSAADLKQEELKEALKTCITSKENIKKELQRTKEEFESNQKKTFNNCQDMLKEQKKEFDKILVSVQEEKDRKENETAQLINTKENELKNKYGVYVKTVKIHHQKCKYSLSECQGKLVSLSEEQSQKLEDLSDSATSCQTDMAFKTSQLESCQNRLRKCMEILNSNENDKMNNAV